MERFTSDEARIISQMLNSKGDARIAEGQSGYLKQIEIRTFDLSSAPTNPIEIGYPFNGVYVQSATDSQTTVSIKFFEDNSVNQYLDLQKNDTLNFENPITKAFINWEAQPASEITIVFLRNGNFRPGSLFTEVSSSVDGNNISTLAPVSATTSATLLYPNDPTATVYTLYNIGGQTVFVGDSTVTIFTGIPVAPNQRITIKNTDALYGVTQALTSEMRILKES